ncbi:MAG: sigma-54 dependent transcriptional regulator/response regulator [Deltaproteobacteria bacterium]|nr:sigma-54 dependent transcriptional regulator/response regulator [Deltaproteobacteria bacterium]
MIKVLIVDDEQKLVEAFIMQLTKEGMKVSGVFNAADALSLLKKESFDVAVVDIRLPDMDGVNLLLKIKQTEPGIEVIMLTGFASVDTAIRSMKLGAYDYLTKPCKLSELATIITKAFEKKSLAENNLVLKEHLMRVAVHDHFIGESKAMKKVKELISIVAPSSTPVLIQGETGTGKEVAARAIHDLSPRAANPFVAINSSALQETILESELFGYKKGAFTGAQSDKLGLLDIANNGTLFVDEIGDMGLTIQAKLLRVLETGTFMKLGDTKETRVDVRFIFATNKDLKEEIEEKRFRNDLFFRINTFVITLPPLRDKKEDIAPLVDYFLDKFRGGTRKHLSRRAFETFMAYDWPGNVRELVNMIERSVLISGKRTEIISEDFVDSLFKDVRPDTAPASPVESSGAANLSSMEDDHIRSVLASVGGNKSEASRLLGISRKKLYSRIKKDR